MQHLRVLAAIDDLGLVSRVADALSLSQSAISKQIAEIEGVVPNAVFYRERNRLYLTTSGKRLAHHAKLVLAQLHAAELEIQALALGETGFLRVGSVTSLVPSLLSQAITRFKAVAPQVSLAVVEGHFLSLHPLLARGEIDLALARTWQPKKYSGIDMQILSAEPVVATCGRNHPLLSKRRLSWAEACAGAWILPEKNTVARQAIEAFFANKGLASPHDVIEAQSLPLSLALLQAMPRLCLLPESLALNYAAKGDLVALDLRLEGVLVEAGCFWREGHLANNPAARLFVDCLIALSD